MSTQVCEPRGLATEPQARTSTKRDTRRRKRIKLSLPVHLRVFDCRFRDIEDVAMVVDFTRDGLFFRTSMPHYFVGMRLEVTFPYGDKVAAHRKFIGSVVRMEDKTGEKRGVAVRFLL
jgi:PilZ domain